jgi:Activator of Hsp90 ATPase homolog 1-like protein
VEVTLEPDGEGTRLILLHHGLPERTREPHRDGWAHYLARLAHAAAGQPPGPDPWNE